jgi:uncharacterized protein (TIGR00369 family)
MVNHTHNRRSAEEQGRLHAAFSDLVAHRITFNQVLGLRLIEPGPGAPVIRFDMQPQLVGHFLYGRLHGGVISTVLDVVGAMALMVAIAEKHSDETAEQVMHRFGRMGTIDLRVDFLRQGIGEHFLATAEVTRLGGRVGSTQMRLSNNAGDLIATAAAAYIVS